MPVGVVLEVRDDPIVGQLVENREEISEFLMEILDGKVNGLAIGFFKTLIHYLFYWFSTPYSTLYDFKATMFADGWMEAESSGYEQARIFRFPDGTPLYDFTRLFAISHEPRNDYISLRQDPLRPWVKNRVLFNESLAEQPEFSKAAGTRYLLTDRQDPDHHDRFTIFEGRAGQDRAWTLNTQDPQIRREIAGRDENCHLARLNRGEQAPPPALDRIRSQRALPEPQKTVQVTQAKDPLVGEAPPKVAKMLKEVYGFDKTPPRARSADGTMIFNATGEPVAHDRYNFGCALSLLSGDQLATIVGHSDRDISLGLPVVGGGHLALQVDDPAEDFVVVKKEKGNYRIQQPGRHDIIVYEGSLSFMLSAKFVNPMKPVPLSQIPRSVQRILDEAPLFEGQNRDGMTLRRAASSQGLRIFYYGTRDIELYQQKDTSSSPHRLRINHPGLSKNGGVICMQENKTSLTFNPSGKDHFVLVTDFVNPRKPEEERYLIIESGKEPLELFFSGVVGTPLCRAPKLNEPAKE